MDEIRIPTMDFNQLIPKLPLTLVEMKKKKKKILSRINTIRATTTKMMTMTMKKARVVLVGVVG